MGGDRLRIILSLCPPLLIIFLFFFGGIFYGFFQSLGYKPAINKYEINHYKYLSTNQSQKDSK